MAVPESKRISALDLAGPVTSSDQIALVQQGKTVRAPLSGVQSLFADGCECTLVSRYTNVGTDNDTGLKYLYTYTVPEDIMTVDGSWLEVHAAGYFAANGNTKYVAIELRDAATTRLITSIPSAVYNDKHWLFDIKYQRSGSDTYMASEYASATTPSSSLQTPGVLHGTIAGNAVNWTGGAVQICVVAQNSTASANDITCNTFIVEAHLLDPNS